MPHGTSYPDPGIEYGSFKVLPYTAGGFVVIDVRRKPGKRTVRHFAKLEDADMAAKAWHEQGHG